MGAPQNLNEALERAQGLTSEKIALRLVTSGTEQLSEVYQLAVTEYQSLQALAAHDMEGKKLSGLPKMVNWEKSAIEAVSRLLGSSGLRQLAQLNRVLFELSGPDEKENALKTRQLLAWLSTGEERKSLQNQALILLSKVGQIPVAIERSLRTPVGEWRKEIGVWFETGGGMSQVATMFADTPIEGILDVTVGSLHNYLQLLALADAQERLKTDTQLLAVLYNRKTQVAARIGQNDLVAYQKAEKVYHEYKNKLEMMKISPDAQMSSDYMCDLERLTKANSQALAKYQKFEARVRRNPAVIDEARTNLVQCLSQAEAYAQTEYRLRSMAVEFRQNALLRASQMAMMITAMSAVFCDQVMAENRLNQENILKYNEELLQAIGRQQVIDITPDEVDPMLIEQ